MITEEQAQAIIDGYISSTKNIDIQDFTRICFEFMHRLKSDKYDQNKLDRMHRDMIGMIAGFVNIMIAKSFMAYRLSDADMMMESVIQIKKFINQWKTLDSNKQN